MASERERRARARAKQELDRQMWEMDRARSVAMRNLREMAPRVRFQERKLQRIRDEQTDLLAAARQAGLTWEQIAQASGVTRQAVQQRVNAVVASAG